MAVPANSGDRRTRVELRVARALAREALIQAWFIDEVRNRGGVAYKLTCAGRKGFPDVLVLYRGTCTFVEIKTERGRLQRIQEYVHNEIARYGGEVVTVFGKGPATELLDMIMGKRP